MSSDALAGGGTPANAAAGSGNSASGTGSAEAGGLSMAQVNEAINRALSARDRRIEEKQAASQQQMLDAIQQMMNGKQPATPEQQSADSGEKLTLKQMIESERKARQDLEKRLQEEQSKAKDARMRGDLREKIASKIGADSPFLKLIVDSLYDAQKRVVDREGVTMLKFADAYGAEDYKPLDDGIKALFDGELKSVVQQSRVSNMPSNGVARSVGAQPQAQRVDNGGVAFNPGLYEILQKSRPDQAEAYKAQAIAAEAERTPKR